MENTTVQEVKMPITYDDLKASMIDSGRPYDFEMIDRAYWDDEARESYKATLDIVCMDRPNLVSDVALALGDMRVPIYSLMARAAEQGRARMSVTVGITNTEHLNSVVARLKKIKDVVSVTRN